MATFAPVVKDVVSKLNQTVLKDAGITYYDIITACNDEYVKMRDEYIRRGDGYRFAITEDVFVGIKDFSYPDFYYSELENELLSSLPIQQTVLSATIKLTNNKISSQAKAYTKGTKADLNNELYVATHDIPSIDSSALTFKASRAKNYTAENKLYYAVGDIIIDSATTFYYRVDTAFQANVTSDLTDNCTRVYWKWLGKNYTTPTFYNYYDFTRTRLYDAIEDAYPFSINNNKIYIKGQPSQFAITYIPEWTYVTDMDAEVAIPQRLLADLKIATLRNIALKLNKGATDEPNS